MIDVLGFFRKGEFTLVDRNKESVSVQFRDNKAVLTASPFKIEFYKADVLVAVVNGNGLFEFEHLRARNQEG